MTNPKPTKTTVAIENRSRGPLSIELPKSVTVPDKYRTLEFGDPSDRGRKDDGGELLPQPEIEVPADVWEKYETAHSLFLQGLVDSGDLVIRT